MARRPGLRPVVLAQLLELAIEVCGAGTRLRVSHACVGGSRAATQPLKQALKLGFAFAHRQIVRGVGRRGEVSVAATSLPAAVWYGRPLRYVSVLVGVVHRMAL